MVKALAQVARISDVAFQTVKYGQLTMQQYTEEMQKGYIHCFNI